MIGGCQGGKLHEFTLVNPTFSTIKNLSQTRIYSATFKNTPPFPKIPTNFLLPRHFAASKKMLKVFKELGQSDAKGGPLVILAVGPQSLGGVVESKISNAGVFWEGSESWGKICITV